MLIRLVLALIDVLVLHEESFYGHNNFTFEGL